MVGAALRLVDWDSLRVKLGLVIYVRFTGHLAFTGKARALRASISGCALRNWQNSAN
jgi:hypothetical protein